MTTRDQHAQGALLGLAVGDAIGTTVEFKPRGSFAPVTDMVGGGPFDLAPGQWTDDTSMALCLATSLLEHGFDLDDQMSKYLLWHDEGYLSSTGHCFDIGMATSAALERYRLTGNSRAGSSNPQSAGNGSIMRLAPTVVYFQDQPDEAFFYSVEQSKTTHRASECLQACRVMAEVLLRALQGLSKEEVLAPTFQESSWTAAMRALAMGAYKTKGEAEIRGTGYVVQSLEAALWCFHITTSFKDCVLLAANLGDDADTTAAIAGQIAGAFYGVNAIPIAWRQSLAMSDKILNLATRLADRP